MTLYSEAEQYLSKIELHANKNFRYATEIAELIVEKDRRKLNQVWDDLLFLAKFLTHAYVVLRREPQSDITQKLSVEFQVNMEKSHSMIKTLVKESSEETKKKFVSVFLGSNISCMENFYILLQELTQIKNYQIDMKQSWTE